MQVGTPERPLSDLGLVSYRGYWTRQLMPILMAREGAVSIKELSDATRIRTDDILTTLNHLNLIQYQKVRRGGRSGGRSRNGGLPCTGAGSGAARRAANALHACARAQPRGGLPPRTTAHNAWLPDKGGAPHPGRTPQGQHVICAPPDLLQKLLREAGSPGLQVDASRIVWSPYSAERELASYRP